MFYTLSEKRQFIDDDFKKMFKDFMKFPTDINAQLDYLKNLNSVGCKWLNRYKDKSQYEYAWALLDDLLKSVEIAVNKG